MSSKERFICFYKSRITRPGSEELLDWLSNESNFFLDPASSKHHLAIPAGLCIHSINVFERLGWLCWKHHCTNPEFNYDNESVAICGLLHDLCKADTYQCSEHLNDQGLITFTYTKNDSFPFGHGEKSVYIINKFMKLTDEEALAIRYHMASWNEWEKNDAGRVFEKSTLAFLLHVADEWATFVDEV